MLLHLSLLEEILLSDLALEFVALGVHVFEDFRMDELLVIKFSDFLFIIELSVL